MTIYKQKTSIKYIINEKIIKFQSFNIPFKYTEDNSVIVNGKTSDNQNINFVLNTDFKIEKKDGTGSSWGNVKFLREVENISSLEIKRVAKKTQEEDLVRTSDFADTMEKTLDKLTIISSDDFSSQCLRFNPDELLIADSTEFYPKKNSFLFFDYLGRIKTGKGNEVALSLRQEESEVPDPTFKLKKEERKNKQIRFDNNGSVVLEDFPYYEAGSNIRIEGRTISVTPYYEAGNNIRIEGRTISMTPYLYAAGENITIENMTISATFPAASSENYGTIKLHEDLKMRGGVLTNMINSNFSEDDVFALIVDEIY